MANSHAKVLNKRVSGVGFEPTPSFEDQNALPLQLRKLYAWVWRLRPLGHPDLSFLTHIKNNNCKNTTAYWRDRWFLPTRVGVAIFFRFLSVVCTGPVLATETGVRMMSFKVILVVINWSNSWEIQLFASPAPHVNERISQQNNLLFSVTPNLSNISNI